MSNEFRILHVNNAESIATFLLESLELRPLVDNFKSKNKMLELLKEADPDVSRLVQLLESLELRTTYNNYEAFCTLRNLLIKY